MQPKVRLLNFVMLLALLALAVFPTPVAAASNMEVIASGLDNPRGLTFGPGGALFVAEAGKGGSGPCVPSPEGGSACFGTSGAITRIFNGQQERILDGLPSLATPDGSQAIGPVDVSYMKGDSKLSVMVGSGGDPANRATFGEDGKLLGHLLRVNLGGKIKKAVDVAAYETVANPDGGAIDSNPYAVQSLRGQAVVADAGANAVLMVGNTGKIKTLAVLPDVMVPAPPFLGLPEGAQIPMQAVPNAVTRGLKGDIFIGQLTGFPFPAGAANVYRLDSAGNLSVYASGFTNIIDIAFDKMGNLYVLEISAKGLTSGDMTGALIKVDKNGNQTTLASEGLVAPGGLVVGPDGSIYVSNFSVMAGLGQVVKITP